jgi:hypothetical protein
MNTGYTVDGVDLSAHAAAAAAHGVSGAIVGTTDAQSISGKIIDCNAVGKGIKGRHFTTSPTWANEVPGYFQSDISGVRRIGWYDGTNNFSIVLPDLNAV